MPILWRRMKDFFFPPKQEQGRPSWLRNEEMKVRTKTSVTMGDV